MLGFQILKSIANSPMSGEELLVILNRISAENKAQNITGMLIYSEGIRNNLCEGRFIQIIEGEENILRERVQVNINEQYHKGVELVKGGVVLSRDFPDWSMGFDSEKLIKYADSQCYFDFQNHLTKLDFNNQMVTMMIMKTFYDEQKKREKILSYSCHI